jgi:BirA family transcriptional regulator, biotin operon repressor / biotin---[acetyl-CoA-carboxylase] ligase
MNGDKIALDLGRHLSTRAMGRVVEIHETIESTNDRARILAREGAAHGTVVVAHTQTKGRGQRGRSWFSPPHAGLYASFIVRPNLAPKRAQALALIAGVALHDAVARAAGIDTRIKWPNDLIAAESAGVLYGRKIAGVLVEASADPVRVDHAVIGIGVNLKEVPRPEPIACYATSLEAIAHAEIDAGELLAALAFELETRLDAAEHRRFDAIEDWARHAAGRGQMVTIEVDNERVRGRLRGIAEDGALILDLESGEERWFHRGTLQIPNTPPRPSAESI